MANGTAIEELGGIDDTNRLGYRIYGDETVVLSCRGHYDNK